MRSDRENLQATGTTAPEDLEPEFTYDELLAELLSDIGEIEQPSAADGWFRIEALVEASDGAQGDDFFRRRAKKLVKAGEWERKDFKKIAYYRKAKR